ncbi:MAG: class IIb bacteriocin, lactobin A/cerein 7B family [Streptococcaceae bacterium]|jgi:lactobin A/cerein 7B family class IIb bacteriocin|nr:class IIb bacteriocin, lactobin A/cerein 7B family [Streptococcaceae bacterium]
MDVKKFSDYKELDEVELLNHVGGVAPIVIIGGIIVGGFVVGAGFGYYANRPVVNNNSFGGGRKF